MCVFEETTCLNMVGLLLRPFLGTALTTGFGVSILSKSSLVHSSTKSRGQLFLFKISYNLSISWWKLIKSEHRLKGRNNNDLIKPILFVSGIKLMKLV